MDAVRSYIYSIASAAVICAVLGVLTGKSNTVSPLMKLMCGIVMTAVVIAPMGKFYDISLSSYLDRLNLDAEAFASVGLENSQEAMRSRIIYSSEAYILEKAAMYDLDIQVSVALDETNMTPTAVEISGNASPAAKRELQNIITQDLGIPPEAQTWK